MSTPSSATYNVAAALVAAGTPDGQSAYLTKGTVEAVSWATMTISIYLAGDTTTLIPGVAFMDGYTPVVGDSCHVVRQGTDLFVLGCVAGASGGGWNAPVLQSGFTTNGDANGIALFRLKLDSGSLKVQWQGSVALSGVSNGAEMCAIADDDYWPSVRRTVVLARTTGQANDVTIDFNTDGTVLVWGLNSAPTIGLAGGTGSSTSQSNTTGASHTHSYTGPAQSGVTAGTAADITHTHNVAVSVTGTATVASPTWISLNNLEYFL